MGWLRKDKGNEGTGDGDRPDGAAPAAAGPDREDAASESAPTGMDPELTLLTVDDAAWLRSAAGAYFGQRGIEVTLHGQHLQRADGRQYGLWNLATSLRGEPDRTQWVGLVDAHFSRMIEAESQSEEDLSDEQFRAMLRLRLMEAGPLQQLAAGGGYEYATEWAPGIVRLLTLDLPTTVVTLSDTSLAGRGAMGELLDLGWRNTADLVRTEELVREQVEHEGRHISCILGDSVYTASLAMMLPDVLQRFEPGVSLAEGVLFSVPFRHQLAYRVIDGRESVLDAVTLLPPFTVNGYLEGTAPVSPHVYLWQDGAVTAITERTETGISVTPPPGAHGIPHRRGLTCPASHASWGPAWADQ